jgi:hypothetical protein
MSVADDAVKANENFSLEAFPPKPSIELGDSGCLRSSNQLGYENTAGTLNSSKEESCLPGKNIRAT